MLIVIIQSLFFMCMCVPLHGMISNHQQRNKVHALLYNKYAIEPVEEPIKIIPAPLPQISFNSVTIITQHFLKHLNEHNVEQKLLDNIIAHPLSSPILSCLNNIALLPQYAGASDLNYIVAKLHEKNKNYHQSDSFYTKIDNVYLKTKKAHLDAFKSRLIASKTFNKKDIAYLSSLAGNIFVQLKKYETNDSILSYKIGVLVKTLLDTNHHIDISNKADLIFKTLHHLEYAQKNNSWYEEDTHMIKKLNKEFYIALATIYEQKNDTLTSLKYIQKAIDNISLSEFAPILNNFINTRKPSFTEKNIATRLLLYDTLQKINYPNALPLITKVAQLYTIMPVELILFTFNHLASLHNKRDSSIRQWQNALDQCNFYRNIGEPTYYDGKTNASIGILLHKKNYSPKKIIPYLKAALDSKQLSKDTACDMQLLCTDLYCAWIATIKDSDNKRLQLLDEALAYDNSGKIRYEKALFILNNSSDPSLVDDARKCLEKNITENCPQKTLSQLELACIYLHHYQNKPQRTFLKTYIPYDVDKALSYLKEHNNDASLLILLINVLTGELSCIPNDVKEKYIDLNEALTYINILINKDSHNVVYLGARMSIHIKLNNIIAILKDINCILTISDAINSSSHITKENLLNKKIELLLTHTPHENSYDEALKCIKKLSASSPDHLQLNNKTIKLIHQYVQNNIIATNNMTDDAIEWACIAADAHMIQRNKNIFHITSDQEKKLTEYLLSAAKINHINALFLIFPYLNETDQLKETYYVLQGLQHAYTALFHSETQQHKTSVILLIKLLKDFVEKGYALPYYILCDYYKNDQKELEKIMRLFSKANKHYYLFNDSSEIIEKICASCRNTLLTYTLPFIKNKKSLIGTLATFTLASMYIHSDSSSLITQGILYLTKVTEELRKYKLPHYANPIQHLLAHAHYKEALITEKETNTIDLELLRRSAFLQYLPAAHKMARLYITQQKNNICALDITTTDFLPMILDDIKDNNPCDVLSLQLYQELTLLNDKL